MIELPLACFETHITAAVAEDLAARLLGDDGPNFGDADFQQLLPVFGEAVLDGLNWELPGELADEMAAAVRREMAENRRPSLYEQLMSGNRWNRLGRHGSGTRPARGGRADPCDYGRPG